MKKLYKIVNGFKVRYTGPYSVDRLDALKANWDIIKSITIPKLIIKQKEK